MREYLDLPRYVPPRKVHATLNKPLPGQTAGRDCRLPEGLSLTPIKQLRKFRELFASLYCFFYSLLLSCPVSSEIHGNIPRQ
jgi:hypothetical protein